MNQQQVPPEAVEPQVSRPPNTLGFVGLILSCVGLLLTFCFWPAAILCLIGAIISAASLNREPKGVAVAGIAVGIAGVILAVIAALFVAQYGQPGTETPQAEPPAKAPSM